MSIRRIEQAPQVRQTGATLMMYENGLRQLFMDSPGVEFDCSEIRDALAHLGGWWRDSQHYAGFIRSLLRQQMQPRRFNGLERVRTGVYVYMPPARVRNRSRS